MKSLIFLLLVAVQVKAQEHWKMYCEGNERTKLIQFNPVYENDTYGDFAQFHSLVPNSETEVIANKGGSYYNLCTGAWQGSGSPSDACVGYCLSALNLMTAIKAAFARDEATMRANINRACVIPTGNTNGQAYARQLSAECSACNNRVYNKRVQNQMEKCLAEYKVYSTATAAGGATGSGHR